YLLTIVESDKESSVGLHAYNIWSFGTVKLNDNVYLPILDVLLPNAFYYVCDISKLIRNGETITAVSIRPWNQNRYINWLNQKSLNLDTLTFSEIIYTRYKSNDELDY